MIINLCYYFKCTVKQRLDFNADMTVITIRSHSEFIQTRAARPLKNTVPILVGCNFPAQIIEALPIGKSKNLNVVHTTCFCWSMPENTKKAGNSSAGARGEIPY